MSKVIGIDLGTTNSCVSVMEGGRAKVIPNKGGYHTTPSIVAFDDDGKRLVGHLAKRQLVLNPEKTVYAAKRLIGRRWGSPEIEKVKAIYPFKLVEGPNKDVRVRINKNELSLPAIGSMILLEMKRVAEDYLGQKVEQAVITVPANFNDSQRQATKDAAAIAGLKVIRIINEPTSAALAYGYGRKESKTIAVYDLGGGTFDISVMEISEGIFHVKASGGNTFLGGDDFDDRLIDHMAEAFLEKEGVDLRRERTVLQRLKEAAEIAKHELSNSPQTSINLPYIVGDKEAGPKHLEMTITCEEFEEMTKDLVALTFSICKRVLKDAKMAAGSIDEVILVGGQTRMPLVQKKVEEFFGKPSRKGVHPDEAVAVGAAIQGELLMKPEIDTLLMDITPLSLGISTFGGHFYKLIERNTTVPTSGAHVFTTAADNQTTVRVHVIQGENFKSVDNELLGEFTLTGIPEATRGTPEIEVTFDIDSNGLVSASARDMATGLEQSIVITASSGISGDELQAMIDKSKEYEVDVTSAEKFKQLKHDYQAIMKNLHSYVDNPDVDFEIAEEIIAIEKKGDVALEYSDVEALGKLLLDAKAQAKKINK